MQNKEIQMRRRDGTSFWAEIQTRIIYDEKGDIQWYDNSLTDKLTEADLHLMIALGPQVDITLESVLKFC